MLNFIIYKVIFPFLYFILFPIFEYFEKFTYFENIFFWIITFIVTIIFFIKISKIEFLKNNKIITSITLIFVIILIIFLTTVIPNYSNFPFQTMEDENMQTSKELDVFFKEQYKFKKANNYNEIEAKILKYYSQKLASIKDQNELNKYFKTYDTENIDKISVIVDTIVFNKNAEYFMATVLIKQNENYSQTSVIGKNKKSIIISQNDCIENVSGSSLKYMRLNVRKFYLIDFNKNENCFKIFGKYNPSDDEYWKKIKEIMN